MTFAKNNPELMTEIEHATKQSLKEGDLPLDVKALARAFCGTGAADALRNALDWILITLSDEDIQAEIEEEERRRYVAQARA
jgi:hypothetical protein